MTAQQTAHDLRSLVSRRVGLKRRVCLLASDVAMVRALEANGCTVLVDPPTLDALADFKPEVIVAFDGFLQADLEASLHGLSQASSADLVVSFGNQGAASSLVSALTGGTPPPGRAELEVRKAFASAGYVVKSRDAVVTSVTSSGLSADTEAALRQLFEQVNPDAAVDRFLFVATRGVSASVVDRTPGLVSVVVTGNDAAALEGTIASLMSQHRRPLELVVASPLSEGQLETLVAKARLRSGLTVALVSTPTEPGAQLNAGIALAHGQYLAFAEAGVLFEPTHLSSLVKALEHGTVAWAIAVTDDTAALRERFERGHARRSCWLLDRERLATFPLTFAEGADQLDAVFFARLQLVFASTVTGLATVDQPHRAVDVAALERALAGRPLRGLTTLSAQLRQPALEALMAKELEAIDPRLRSAFDTSQKVVGRVRQAWAAARAEARKR